jgi:hypothetical protein
MLDEILGPFRNGAKYLVIRLKIKHFPLTTSSIDGKKNATKRWHS